MQICAPGASHALAAKLDETIDAALAASRLVGVEVLLAVDGRMRYRRAAGWSDREAGVALAENGLFRLASLSKLYVACAAMRLAVRGELRLDAAVSDYLPYFAPGLADGSVPAITLRSLLSHTSGLGYGFLQPAGGAYRAAGVSDGLDHAGISLEDNLRRLAALPLWHAPGTAWTYSLGLDVMGGVLEAVCGAPLADIVRREVAVPLGLADTGFHAADPARLGAAYADGPVRMAERHALQMAPELAGIDFAPGRALDASAFPSGGAGMVGTASDFLALLEALRRGGDGWLPPEAVAELARSHTGGLEMEGWPGWSHGLGFAVLRDPAAAGLPASRNSWRWLGAYGHGWLVDPARGISLVACSNTAFEGAIGAFGAELIAAVYAGLDHRDGEAA
ncbi:serine hydrolase [Chromobacterium vaccinii]|uniref:serine hydrolase domain-containing protein n=1 Tax=Chromobacterium vaccinii TaxID=1108595 RepID=UPI000CE976DD|nr:serine hydrolase domain-containing protein [Chromobacterium vaccinii]AVG15338.1 serine hydrolase [Chromobacterium vaccinii]